MEGKRQTEFWLIGECKNYLPTEKLPSNQDVICLFIHSHVTERNSIAISANFVAEKLIAIWNKFEIPHQTKRSIVRKIIKLYETYLQLKRNINRNSEIDNEKRQNFRKDGYKMFDIAQAMELQKINDPEKLEFLEHHRNYDSSVRFLRSMKMKCSTITGDPQPSVSAPCSSGATDMVISDISSLTLSSSGSEYQPPVAKKSCDTISPQLLSSSKIRIIDKDVASALDRTKISNAGAALVVATTANALGHDLRSISISKETVRRSRQKARAEISNEILASFNSDSILTVHWDGKMLEDVTHMTMVDRLCVIISGNGNTKLLGVPKIAHGTGSQQAEMVLKMIVDWNVTENIKGLCFDTTASNVGINSGACILIEKKLGRNLLWFACRHHIYELIVSAVFTALLKEVSSGPDIQLFKRFKTKWNTLNKNQVKSGLNDTVVLNVFNPTEKSYTINFINAQLKRIDNGRDDYMEFLLLALLFLGEPLTVTIRQPGAISRARWMAKIIYSLKIYLFRDQFKLNKTESKGLCEFNIFVVKVYLPKWFTCMNATTAPRNDLLLLKELIAYKNINSTASIAALKSFSNHLWYLSDTLVSLSFFDRNLNNQTKEEMVNKLGVDKNTLRDLKKANISQNIKEDLKLIDFVSSHSKKFFEILFGRMPEFFEKHPETWPNDIEYLRIENIVNNFLVVNDVAERGISLIKNYNAILTHQEEYKQYLLQVVEQHYKKIPVLTKENIKAALKEKD